MGLGFCQQSKTKSHEISAADRGLRYQIASCMARVGFTKTLVVSIIRETGANREGFILVIYLLAGSEPL